MKTNNKLHRNIYKLTLASSILVISLAGCSKENVEPSSQSLKMGLMKEGQTQNNIGESVAVAAVPQTVAVPKVELKLQKKDIPVEKQPTYMMKDRTKLTTDFNNDFVIMTIDQIAPFGSASYKLELFNDGSVRFTGNHDVAMSSAQIQIDPAYREKIWAMIQESIAEGNVADQVDNSKPLSLASVNHITFCNCISGMVDIKAVFDGSNPLSRWNKLKSVVANAINLDGLVKGTAQKVVAK